MAAASLYAACAARGFGDGFAIIILSVYCFLAAHYDLRNLLLLTAFVMLTTGIADRPDLPGALF